LARSGHHVGAGRHVARGRRGDRHHRHLNASPACAQAACRCVSGGASCTITHVIRCQQQPDFREETMTEQNFGRRDFLKTAVVGGAAAATTGIAQPQDAQAQQPVAAAPVAAAPPATPTYAYLNPEEAAFVEALVDHMVPADELSPKGTDLGINIYIDRSLAGGWGKGDRLYMQGPWKRGVPNQGYQLPLTPAELYRAGIDATNAYCRKTYKKT